MTSCLDRKTFPRLMGLSVCFMVGDEGIEPPSSTCKDDVLATLPIPETEKAGQMTGFLVRVKPVKLHAIHLRCCDGANEFPGFFNHGVDLCAVVLHHR